MIAEADFERIAGELGCDVAAIKAVNKVEAPRGAYDMTGKLTILFEPFIFWKALRNKGYTRDQLAALQKQHPTILSPIWNPSLYGHYSEQWNKLNIASTINKEAAYESASYGAFQVLGDNYKSLGFSDVFSMVNCLAASEVNQLNVFAKYVEVNHLDDELIHHDWAGFSAGYNGVNYRKDGYDIHLKQAYQSFLN